MSSQDVRVPARIGIHRVFSSRWLLLGAVLTAGAAYGGIRSVVEASVALLGLGLLAAEGVRLITRPDGVSVGADTVEIRDLSRSRVLPRAEVSDVEVRRNGDRASVFILLRRGEPVELRRTRVRLRVRTDSIGAPLPGAVVLERFVTEVRSALSTR